MKVHQFHAVDHSLLFKDLDRMKNFRRGQTELCEIAARGFPFATTPGLQLAANANQRAHAELFGDFQYLMQLGELLDDDDHFFAKL